MDTKKWKKICNRDLKENIQKERKFNPFCDDSNLDIIKKYKLEYNQTFSEEEYILLSLLPYYNNLYQTYYGYLKAMHNKYGWSVSTLTKYLIAFINRERINGQLSALESIKNSDWHFDDLNAAMTVKNIVGEDVNLARVLDTEVDMLNTIVHYYQYYEECDQITTEFDSGDLKKLILITNIFQVVNENFKNIIWNGKKIIAKEDKVIKVKASELDQYKCIGMACLHRFMEEEFIAANNLLQIAYKRLEQEKSDMFHGKNQYRIASLNAGKIILKRGNYGAVVNNSTIAKYWGILKGSQMHIFCYQYDKPLEQMEGLCIDDMYALLARLKVLLEAAIKKSHLDGDIQSNDLNLINEYGFYIEEQELINYLADTKYKVRQIKRFLKIISTGDNKYDFWQTPVYYQDGKYYFLIHALLNSNPCHFTEAWLEKNGINIAERGLAFEKHVKENLQNMISDEVTIHQMSIIKGNMFETKDGKREEIDLLLFVDGYLILGELKALIFPMNAISWRNYRTKLSKGLKQAKRKAGFIKEHSKELFPKMEDIPVVFPIVITNYTFYTGYIKDSVPILDEQTFYNILENEPRTLSRLQNGKVQKVKRQYYYHGVEDFKENFTKVFTQLPQIEELKRVVKSTYERIPFHDMWIEDEVYFVRHDLTQYPFTEKS